MNDHTCNAWCTPPTHYHLVLISPNIGTREDILAYIAPPYYRLHKRVILDAKRAREADKTRVVEEKRTTVGISTRNRLALCTRAELAEFECWLITYIQEDESRCTPASSN